MAGSAICLRRLLQVRRPRIGCGKFGFCGVAESAARPHRLDFGLQVDHLGFDALVYLWRLCGQALAFAGFAGAWRRQVVVLRAPETVDRLLWYGPIPISRPEDGQLTRPRRRRVGGRN